MLTTVPLTYLECVELGEVTASAFDKILGVECCISGLRYIEFHVFRALLVGNLAHVIELVERAVGV